MSEELITKIVNEFDPISPLQPNDRRYVECSDERGSVDLFKSLAKSIRRSKKRTCQLLSGHRGCGKTTELYRTREQWQLLHKVAETKHITEADEYSLLLENFSVLEYRDIDGPWYDVNPVIREAPQFKA